MRKCDVQCDAESMTRLFRVVRLARARDAFMRQPGDPQGRWNSEGTPALYAAMTPAGAMLERLVHGDDTEDDALVVVEALMPSRLISSHPPTLPSSWRGYPYRAECQRIGDGWLSARAHVGIRVPSVLAPRAINVLIDPTHADAIRLIIRSVSRVSHHTSSTLRTTA